MWNENHARLVPNGQNRIDPETIVLGGDVPSAVDKILRIAGNPRHVRTSLSYCHTRYQPDRVCVKIKAALDACLNLSLSDCVEMARARSNYEDPLIMAALLDTLTCHADRRPDRHELKALVLQTLATTIASMGTTTVCNINKLLQRLNSAAKVPPEHAFYTLLRERGGTSHAYLQTLMLLYTVGITTGGTMLFQSVSRLGGLEFISDGLPTNIRYRLDAPHEGSGHDHGPGASNIHLHIIGADGNELRLYFATKKNKVMCY